MDALRRFMEQKNKVQKKTSKSTKVLSEVFQPLKISESFMNREGILTMRFNQPIIVPDLT
jgi:hypothetical protein